ncbi:MAG: transcriptional regulator [Bacteroidales bacterium]|nr:transcriptional regulator [Bacteroidales bacterium]
MHRRAGFCARAAEAGYIRVSRSGEGRGSHTVCRITSAGTHALQEYQRALLSYFR